MPRRVLLVDNDPVHLVRYAEALSDAGLVVGVSHSPEACLKELERHRYGALVVDLMMPHGIGFSPADTGGGMRTGVALARRLKRKYPALKVAALTVWEPSAADSAWFDRHGGGVWLKAELTPDGLVRRVARMFRRSGLGGVRAFIVHGHATRSRNDLTRLLQRTFRMPQPIVLAEQEDLGRTVIEKFEQVANDVDVVLVLATPDDVGRPKKNTTDGLRARQNVIFELGYFYGRLGRRSGRVILLRASPTEIPSDLAGVVCVDISKGVGKAAPKIRKAIAAGI